MISILRVQRLQLQKLKWLVTKPKQYRKTNKTLRLFLTWCEQEFEVVLYDYEVEIAWWLLASLIVESIDVFVKMARQSGKTETVTLLVRFLIIFFRILTDSPLRAAFASPKGEQAKTDTDRVKKAISQLRERWQVEDREFNAKTIRAYRFDVLCAEIFTFSLSPTTQNESKTLRLLILEESHKADHKKRSDELDPMLASTAGPTWHFGVGCPVMSDYKRGCDCELPDSVALIIPAARVIADRRRKYRETGDVRHLNYEKTYQKEVRKKGKHNPEIRRNYLVEDTVEEGNFVSRDRLLSCARPRGVGINTDRLFVGIDWARSSDSTWLTVVNAAGEVVDWFKYPHVPYEQQVELMKADLERKRTAMRTKPDGAEEEYEWCYKERVLGVRADDTGMGGPTEILQMKSGLPVGDESFFKFTLQGKNELYLGFEEAVFKDAGTEGRFSYPADHPLAGEFEEQTTALVREYKGDGEYLVPHHPDETGAHDDAPDSTALALLAARNGFSGEIMFV